MEKRESAGWKFEYCWTLRSQELSDFATICDNHPASRFPHKRVCSRATPESRITPADEMLIITTDRVRGCLRQQNSVASCVRLCSRAAWRLKP